MWSFTTSLLSSNFEFIKTEMVIDHKDTNKIDQCSKIRKFWYELHDLSQSKDFDCMKSSSNRCFSLSDTGFIARSIKVFFNQ